MHLSPLARADVNVMTQLLKALMDEDGGQRRQSVLFTLQNPGDKGLVVWSTGRTPAFWLVVSGTDLVVFIGGAETTGQGIDLLTAALATGVPVGRAYVNGAAGAQALFIDNVVRAAVPQFPQSVLACGHSYGGAIAQVLIALWVQFRAGPFFSLYTQGAPRAGAASLSAVLDPVPKLRVMTIGDPVPFFPPHFSEAPIATVSLGFFQAYNLSFWAQTGGGAVLDQQGNLTPGQLPPWIAPIQDVNLATWATGVNGFASAEHFYGTYTARLLLPTVAAPAPPVDPSAGGFKGEYVLPVTPAELAAGPIQGPLLQEGRLSLAFQSVFIPVAYRWKPVRVGLVWWATWQGLQVVACQSHSQAKSICKAFNKGLKVLQNATSCSKGLMQSTWNSYLVAASSSTSGFSPVLTVLP